MRASVRLELRRSTDGGMVQVRHARNSVMRAGAELVAGLFSGTAPAAITHMAVGTSAAPESDSFTTGSLTTTGGSPDDALKGDTETPVAPGDFVIKTDATRRLVLVQLHATLPNAAAVGTLREAGLLSRNAGSAVLYNRVTFAPIEKHDDHELTMFWEVTFPYGDLNWM